MNLPLSLSFGDFREFFCDDFHHKDIDLRKSPQSNNHFTFLAGVSRGQKDNTTIKTLLFQVRSKEVFIPLDGDDLFKLQHVSHSIDQMVRCPPENVTFVDSVLLLDTDDLGIDPLVLLAAIGVPLHPDTETDPDTFFHTVESMGIDVSLLIQIFLKFDVLSFAKLDLERPWHLTSMIIDDRLTPFIKSAILMPDTIYYDFICMHFYLDGSKMKQQKLKRTMSLNKIIRTQLEYLI